MCLGLQSRVRAVACCSSDSSTSGPTSDTRSLVSSTLSLTSAATLLGHLDLPLSPPLLLFLRVSVLPLRPGAQMAGIDLNPESRSPGKTYPADTYLPTYQPTYLPTSLRYLHTPIQRTITHSRTASATFLPPYPFGAGKCISARRAAGRNARAACPFGKWPRARHGLILQRLIKRWILNDCIFRERVDALKARFQSDTDRRGIHRNDNAFWSGESKNGMTAQRFYTSISYECFANIRGDF